MDIALIAPPWPLFNRPSIQIGVLSAFMKARVPGIRIRTYHPYLDIAARIGFDRYNRISQSSWAAESVFAALLFPERSGPKSLFYRAIGKRFGSRARDLDFGQVVSCAEEAAAEFISRVKSPDLRLVGISLCLNQLTAGLYLAKKIKENMPDACIVLGGASSSGTLAGSLLEYFPFVDYAIVGEGELPLLDLWHFLSGKKDEVSSPAVLGRGKDKKRPYQKEQLEDLNKLPPPDFSDYFAELRALGEKGAGISPVLPIEASRGCWWSRCNFCNLNLQWKGYRMKSPARIAREVDFLSRKYQALDFAFMDNCLPKRQAPVVFDYTRRHNRDYSFFAELRTGHPRTDLARMAAGGLKDVQVGIEALSTSLLKRLGKGVHAIDNLAVMRHCTEWDIVLQANLILHFPGSSDEEVRETLEALDFTWPFAALKTVSFWLGVESPVYKRPRDFGIWGIKPSRFYGLLFPEKAAARLKPMILEYKGDRNRQKKMWKKVEKKVAWMNRLKAGMQAGCKLLSFRDGGQFLIIRQVLPGGKTLKHRLSGLSRSLYLACLEPVSLDRLSDIFEGLSKDKICAFVDDLYAKRLMFREGERVLSLAVREKGQFITGNKSKQRA